MAVYLDYNATTPVDEEVQEVIGHALKMAWGNPSSSYTAGKEAKNLIKEARCKVADMIKSLPEEIVFTSGGTESNNMVIHSIIRHFHSELKNSDCDEKVKPHIITTNIEHDSIKLPLEVLAKKGEIDVTFVPVSHVTGAVVTNDIINAVRANTCLITVMLANNETGVIQPVSSIKCHLDKLKSRRLGAISHTIFLHTDAAQAFGKINVDVDELGVDYLTIVGHKFYGPRVGALYFKRFCPLYPIFYGGGQERNLRPGTENTCMLAGLGKAAEQVTQNLKKYDDHMAEMCDYLQKTLKDAFSDNAIFHFVDVPRIPNTLSVAFNYDNITGNMILEKATEICASTGAACHSKAECSAVLLNSGISKVLASKTLRLSVGRETTVFQIDEAVNALEKALESLKAL